MDCTMPTLLIEPSLNVLERPSSLGESIQCGDISAPAVWHAVGRIALVATIDGVEPMALLTLFPRAFSCKPDGGGWENI